MYTIKFKFEQKGLEPVTLENIAPDQSILEVALDNNIVNDVMAQWCNDPMIIGSQLN